MIGFGAGEPDFPTPDYIVEAAVEACRDPTNHRYTPAGGLPELKQAIVDKTRRDCGYDVEPAQVLVTNGGKQAIYEAFATMLDPGDEVLAAGAVLDDLPRGDPAGRRRAGRGARRRDPGLQGHRRPARGGAHRPHQGAAVLLAVQPDRRGLHPEEVEAIGRWVVEHELWVVTDEIYEHLDLRRRRDRLDAGAWCPSSPTAASSSTASPRPTR